jgi:hypothetical protein
MTYAADLANLFRTASVTMPETRPGGSQQERRYRCQRYKRGDSEDSLGHRSAQPEYAASAQHVKRSSCPRCVPASGSRLTDSRHVSTDRPQEPID